MDSSEKPRGVGAPGAVTEELGGSTMDENVAGDELFCEGCGIRIDENEVQALMVCPACGCNPAVGAADATAQAVVGGVDHE